MRFPHNETAEGGKVIRPVAPGASPFPPSPLESQGPKDWTANPLSAPTTPSKRLPNVDREHADPQIVKAAEGMEGMFLDEMMKVMRQTVPKNEMDLESPATDIYRGMLDTEYAQKAAHTGGIGLADQIIAYLESQSYTQNRPQSAPGTPSKADQKAPTGGAHEGRSYRR